MPPIFLIYEIAVVLSDIISMCLCLMKCWKDRMAYQIASVSLVLMLRDNSAGVK